MEILNVNGSKFLKTDTVKVFNLSHELKFNFDIYIQSEDADSLEWILTPNDDLSAKIKFILDGSQEFEITSGNPGDTFSNPIVYYRNSEAETAVVKQLPAYNRDAARLPFYFLGGSNASSYGADWSKQLNPQYVEETVDPITGIVSREIKSEEAGIEANYINYNANDHIVFEIQRMPSTNDSLLNYYMKNITIIIEPSIHEQLPDHYQYNSSKDYMTKIIKIGVTY